MLEYDSTNLLFWVSQMGVRTERDYRCVVILWVTMYVRRYHGNEPVTYQQFEYGLTLYVCNI